MNRGSRAWAIFTLLADHPEGLTVRELITKNGADPTARVQAAYGTILRSGLRQCWLSRHRKQAEDSRGRSRSTNTWTITQGGHAALAAAESRPARALRAETPGPSPRTAHQWEAETVRRHIDDGESIHKIAEDLGRWRESVARAIEANGFAVVKHRPGPPPAPQPAWAPAAAERYLAGETCSLAATQYGVSHGTMRRILIAEGVQIRGRKEAAAMRKQLVTGRILARTRSRRKNPGPHRKRSTAPYGSQPTTQ